jgi:general secretion pathway protein J
MRHQGSRGFTLFELLVATVLLLIMSAIAFPSLIQIENDRDKLKITETRLAAIQMAFLNFERDLQQAVQRPIRDQYGNERPALGGQGDFLLELTRGGLRNPAHVARSLLQRVAYVVEDENLERLNWLVLDQAQDSLPVKTVLLKKITTVDIRFLDTAGEWSNFWPPPATSTAAIAPGTTAPPAPSVFPRAVSVKLELPDVGTIERIFLVPQA